MVIDQEKAQDIYSRDGMCLKCLIWEPSFHLKGVVSLIHGLGGHAARYSELCQLFANNGLAVVAVDLRGHGKSEGRRGHVDDVREYLEDIEMLVRKTKVLFSGVPHFIFAHSMGATLVGSCIRSGFLQKTPIDGVIMSAPWLELKKELSPFRLSVLKAYRKFCLFFRHEPMYTRKRKKTKNEEKDDLVNDSFSFGLFFQMHQMGQSLSQMVGSFSLPVLVLGGGDDSIMDVGSVRAFGENGGDLCAYHEFSQAGHDLCRDVGASEIWKVVNSWVDCVLVASDGQF